MVAKGAEGWEREGLGVWVEQRQTIIHGMDEEQGPAVEHRELDSIPCDKPQWERIRKRIYIRVTESLCCTAEMNTTL